MSLPRVVLTDRTGLLGAGGSLLAGVPPALAAAYLLLRLIIPVFLIVLVSRGATPAQRIGLVRDYLLGVPTSPQPDLGPAPAIVPPALPAPDPATSPAPEAGDRHNSR